MSKPSSRDVQMFVAGALALTGFQALIWMGHYLFASSAPSGFRIVGYLVAGLALPIGISVLLGHVLGSVVARVYLWIVVIGSCIAIMTLMHFFPEKSGSASVMIHDLPVAVLLLVLTFWSGSGKPRSDQSA